jgi:hypothetical protein
VRYSTITTAPPADVFKYARDWFGPSRCGLRLVSQDLSSVGFSSPAGAVRVEARRTHDDATEVVIEAREFDAEAVEFIRALPRAGYWRRISARIGSYRTPKTTP